MKSFPDMSLCKTSNPWGGAFFDEVNKIQLHTEYQRPGPSCFRQYDF